jgi:hypothetical protein
MNKNDKILVSLTAGIAIGAVLGILLTKEKRGGCESNARGMKIMKDLFEGLGKKDSKPATLKEDIEEAVKEAFAENPEEYC